MSDKYDIEELLDLLESDSEVKVKKEKKVPNNKNVLDFISDYDIEPGDILVPNYLIYYVYKTEWTGRDRTNKLKKRAFFQTFGAKFQQKRKASYRGYLLNDCFKLNDEKLKIAYEYDKKLEKISDTRKRTKKEKQKEERIREKRFSS